MANSTAVDFAAGAPSSDAAALAEQWGLKPIGVVPRLIPYTRSIWERRQFVLTFARSRIDAANAQSRLGQLWQVLNPLLNALVYYLIFGVVFKGKNRIPDFIPFMVTGVFIFTYTQRTIASCSSAIPNNIGLVRALHFPRAILPVAEVIEQIIKFATSLVVLAVLILAFGEPLTWKWILIVPAVILQTMFNAGVGFLVARLGSQTKDISQFLPFLLRTWLYFSGVFYYIPYMAGDRPHLRILLELNPGAVYINLARNALLDNYPCPVWDWYLGVGWAVLMLGTGFWFFWKAEARYGR